MSDRSWSLPQQPFFLLLLWAMTPLSLAGWHPPMSAHRLLLLPVHRGEHWASPQVVDLSPAGRCSHHCIPPRHWPAHTSWTSQIADTVAEDRIWYNQKACMETWAHAEHVPCLIALYFSGCHFVSVTIGKAIKSNSQQVLSSFNKCWGAERRKMFRLGVPSQNYWRWYIMLPTWTLCQCWTDCIKKPTPMSLAQRRKHRSDMFGCTAVWTVRNSVEGIAHVAILLAR